MRMRREWCMPSSETFTMPPVRAILSHYLRGTDIVVDPFARNSRWGTITNDLSPQTEAQHHMPAMEFARMLMERCIVADVILFDPPYSAEQAKRVYDSVGIGFSQRDGQVVNSWREEKDLLNHTLRAGGLAICCGWNSIGFGKARCFEMLEVLLCCHGAGHNDTIITVERKSTGGLFDTQHGKGATDTK